MNQQSPATILATAPSWSLAAQKAAHDEEHRRAMLKTVGVLRRLSQNNFWKHPDDLHSVSTHASQLAKALLFAISPIASSNDVQNLYEGIIGGPSNYNREGADKATQTANDYVALIIDLLQAGEHPFATKSFVTRDEKLRNFGRAVRQLCPGKDMGAGENHLVNATVTYLTHFREEHELALV